MTMSNSVLLNIMMFIAGCCMTLFLVRFNTFSGQDSQYTFSAPSTVHFRLNSSVVGPNTPNETPTDRPTRDLSTLEATHLRHSESAMHSALSALPTRRPKEKVRIVVFIPSAIPSAERRLYVNRQFHRERWSHTDVRVLWVFGSKDGDRLEKDLDTRSVYEEHHMHKDNIIMTDCRDMGDAPNNPNGTSATTCKFYEAMRYVYDNFEAEYVWRGADDAYLNLRLFFQMMPTLPKSTMWMGQMRSSRANFDLEVAKAQPEISKLFGFTHFPTAYMLGMGSAFTYDVAELFGTWSIPPHLTWCEDVMVGMWLSMFKIQRVDRPDLFINRAGSAANMYPLDGTYGNLSVLLVHYIQNEDWGRIDENGYIVIPCPKGGHC